MWHDGGDSGAASCHAPAWPACRCLHGDGEYEDGADDVDDDEYEYEYGDGIGDVDDCDAGCDVDRKDGWRCPC